MISLRPDEKVLKIYRRHIFVLLLETTPLIFFVCMIIVGAFLGIPLLSSAWTLFIPLLLFGVSLFVHLLWVGLFVMLADFYLDVCILTNQRLITIEQKKFFSRTVSEFDLVNIQDITVDMHGIFATFLNYGTISLRTASESQHFICVNTPYPLTIKEEINNARLSNVAH